MGVATFFFFFFFFVSGLKLDEKSIENGLEGQKFLVVCLFWGGCHHPNNIALYYSYCFIPCRTNCSNIINKTFKSSSFAIFKSNKFPQLVDNVACVDIVTCVDFFI